MIDYWLTLLGSAGWVLGPAFELRPRREGYSGTYYRFSGGWE
jgi:hypothetical protein